MRRYLSGPLTMLGIDPKRYWLLTDLFNDLSERGEMMDQLGRNGVALDTMVKIYFGVSVLLTIVLGSVQLPLWTYFSVFAVFTLFLLLTVLLSETSNSLVNPTEGLVLAHYPINGATYTAAKLSHLFRIVVYMVLGLNAVPALGGFFLKEAAWHYPILHLAAMMIMGLLLALVCCAVFGWMVRFVPVKRLKAAGQFASVLPFLAMVGMKRIERLLRSLDAGQWIPSDPASQWALGLALVGLTVASVIFGIRSLSADYLIRVSGMVRGGAARASSGSSWMEWIVERYFGGQAGRAGFAYFSRMMRRDWQFRRQIIGVLVPCVMGLGSAAAAGWPSDPFAGRFAPVHLMPHMLGFILFGICGIAAYGNDYKGAWIFGLVRPQAFDGFARGIHALLWMQLIAMPHLLLLPLFLWLWGAWHALLFVAYSVVVAFGYLALLLILIQYVPFTQQVDATRGTMLLPAMIGGAAIAGIIVALQHFVLFHSPLATTIATFVIGAAAYFGTRKSVSAFAASMRYRLGLNAAQGGRIYQEIET